MKPILNKLYETEDGIKFLYLERGYALNPTEVSFAFPILELGEPKWMKLIHTSKENIQIDEKKAKVNFIDRMNSSIETIIEKSESNKLLIKYKGAIL